VCQEDKELEKNDRDLTDPFEKVKQQGEKPVKGGWWVCVVIQLF